jgi:hypothetical protein
VAEDKVHHSKTQQATKKSGFVGRWLASLGSSPRLLLIFVLLALQVIVAMPADLGAGHWVRLLRPLSTVIWLAWFVVLFIMVTPSADKWLKVHLKPLKWAAVSLSLILCLVGSVEIVGIVLLNKGILKTDVAVLQTADNYEDTFIAYNDGTAMGQMAAEQLLHGINPYMDPDYVEAVDTFEVPIDRTCPLMQGDFADDWPAPTTEECEAAWEKVATDARRLATDFESRLCYPAGYFLFLTPFVAAGLNDVRYFYLLCLLLMFAVIMWQTPKRLWPLVILVALGSLELWNDVASGGTTGLYLLFLLLGWVLLRKNIWASAAFMGLAATSKQLAWFFVLFYLILILRTIGWRRCFQVGTVIGVVFLVTNVPFVVGGPLTWLKSVFAPLVDPLFPVGVGIVSFSIAGIISPGMHLMYTLMEIGVLLACLVWYYYRCGKYPDSGLALAVLPLFFAWRSFSIYMSTAAILVFAVVVISHGRSTVSLDPAAVEGQDRGS